MTIPHPVSDVRAGALLAFACVLSFAADLPAQEAVVAPPRQLSVEPAPFGLVESFLAVNPLDSSNLVASAMSVSARESVLFFSRDGGRTWQASSGSEGTVFTGGDPVVAFDGGGRAYFSTINPLRVWRSEDGGETWIGPATLTGGPGYDRQWMAVSTRPALTELPLYVTAKRLEQVDGREQDVIVTAVSHDAGRTFVESTMPVDSGFLHVATDILMREDGTLFLPFVVNYGRMPGVREMYRGKRWIIVSRDGGATWSTPHLISDNAQYGNAVGDQAMKGLGGGDLATDETQGRFAGRLYTVWPAILDDRLQIVASHSTDDGLTWSEPIRVNDGGFTSNHSSPMVAVDEDGIVGVSWNDRRDDRSDLCFRHYVAFSFDGGHSFGPSQPVSEVPTCPGRGSRWMNGGETNGLAAVPGGFRLTWTQGNAPNLHIWTTVVGVVRDGG